MAKNKENKTSELLEEPVQNKKNTKESSEPVASKLDFENLFDKYKKVIAGVVAVFALGALAYVGYIYVSSSQNEEAAKEMFYPENYFQRDSFDLALNGDKVNRGFLEIAEEYSLSESANLCNFYIGVCYLKKGKFEDAIEYLKKFKSNDFLVQARAYSNIGDAYSELNDNENAISYYKKASDYAPNEFFTPRYLMKLAFAYEANKDFENAIKTYSTIIDNFGKSQSQEYNDARKYKARAEELAAQ
jgi:tetratricopeptide (TPR) repeat protein